MFKIFGKHYGTERFFIMIFLCLAIIIGLFAYGGKLSSDARKTTLSSTPLYTGSYTWSRTSATGSVVSLIADERKTKVFMLLKNDAFTSFDARDYEVFFTNLDKAEERANDPALTIYSYGASGYVGFYFTDARGFANQLLNIIVRNDSAASDMANETTLDPNAVRDQSFIDHNQIQIIANFGATGIETSPVFDGDNVNQLKLFANTAGMLSDGTSIMPAFDAAVARAEETLTKMTQARLKYEQYAQNLSQMAIVVPDVPYYISGDVIDTVPIDFDKTQSEFDESMIIDEDYFGGSLLVSTLGGSESDEDTGEADAVESGANAIAEGSGPEYADENGNRVKYSYYHTDYIVPGAVQLDYQGKLISDGFITQTSFYNSMEKPDPLKAYDNYAAWRDAMKEAYADAMSRRVSYDAWRKRDGSYVDMTDADMSGAPKVINLYVSALNEYLSYKHEYYTYMDQILDIEHKVFMLGQNTTVNSGSEDWKNIWVY